MKKLLILGLILSVMSINVLAQERIITGIVYNESNLKLINIKVCQTNSLNCNSTDHYGVFHLVVDKRYENSISINDNEYMPLIIEINDTTKTPLIIKLVRDTTQILKALNNVEFDQEFHPNNTPYAKIGFDFNILLDFTNTDFSSFNSALGLDNTELLNSSGRNMVYEFVFKYNHFRYGAGFGYLNFDNSIDSLDLNLYNYQYALHFGYDILDSRHFTITPLVRFKWHHLNLVNSAKGYEMPLDEYSANQDLEIKFNQLTGFIGCNLAYKTGLVYSGFEKIGVGLFGGYVFKLNDKPWIYSAEHRLTTNNKIALKNYNFGMYFIFYFED